MQLFNDLKARTIIIVTLMIIIFGLIIGFFNYKRAVSGPDAISQVEQVPSSLTSIPGQQHQNIEYAKLQKKENVLKVEQALRHGTSAIPTIIETSAISAPDKPATQVPENARALALAAVKQAGCSPESVKSAKAAGASASELRQLGCTLEQIQAADYSADDLLKAGFTIDELKRLGYGLTAFRNAGVCSCDLKHAGYTAIELKQAGFTAADLNCACFSDDELVQAGFPAGASMASSIKGCDADALAKARAQGATPTELKQLGCNATQLQQLGLSASDLKQAGYSPEALKLAGYTASDLIAAGYTPQQLKNSGYTAQELRNAGVSAKQLQEAGYTAAQLRDAGYTAVDLKQAGFTAGELKQVGFSAQQLKDGGFSEQDLQGAGFSPSELAQAGISNLTTTSPTMPGIETVSNTSNDQIATLAAQQQQQFTEQQLKQSQQEVQANMLGQAQQLFGKWTTVSGQVLIPGEIDKETSNQSAQGINGTSRTDLGQGTTMLKAGTIMFAVLDTAVNSDEPGPVMATIVDGQFKGGKLLGTLQPFGQNADRVMLSFNKLSLPNAPQSIGVNAVAIDPNTARTALSSLTDHHYLLRYGSLFASSFLQGYGQAVMQSGTIEIDRDATKVRQTKNLTSDELAAAGLGQVGQTWGTQLGSIFNRPATIHVYAGTSVGILFRDDIQQAK